MKRWDQRAALFGLGVGTFILVLSLRLDLGAWNRPGPGFMPLGAGLLLILLCLIYFIRSRWGTTGKEKESPWPKEGKGRLMGALGALFLYALLVPILGYFITTFLLMIFLFRAGGPQKWARTVALAGLTVLATYLVFEKWLMVQFPKGFWGI